jgi:membrane-anchored protein YejM (alkaline phosphatase superfamily)
VKLIADKAPHALFLQLDELDAAGHKGGYHPENPSYLEAVANVDRLIGSVLDAVTARKASHPQEPWLVLVVSDHGGTADRRHGGPSREEVFVPFFLFGDGVKPGKLPADTANVDAAATALAWLGLEIDPAWELDGQPRGRLEP